MPRAARVIVTTYERLPSLRLALRGYLRQTTTDFTLVVADDGSGPETGAFVREFAGAAAKRGIDVEHVWIEDEGFRKTVVLNDSLRKGHGEPLVIFSDGDCIPPARFVEHHLRVHEPMSFQVGGAFEIPEEAAASMTEADVDAGRHETMVTEEARRYLRRRARKSRWGVWLHRRNRPKVFGANMAADLDLLKALNGFDEQFAAWGMEDSDLRDRAMRLRPRPPVKILDGVCDVAHLWHPRAEGRRAVNRDYYRSRRPVRCVQGLVKPGEEPGAQEASRP